MVPFALFRRLVGPRNGAYSEFPDSFSTLDFSHLATKGVGYARHRNLPKEVIEVRTLPPRMVQALAPFAPLFSKRVFRHVQVLVAGAILAPGKRTVTSALRAMGLDREKRFHRYHRVLSRAGWSSLEASRVLLGLVVEAFVPEGYPLVVGIDETLREEDLGQGRLPRSGPFHPPNLRQEQRPKVGLRDGVGGDPLGFEGVGFALLERPGPFRALCRPARQTAQEDNRMGLADALGSKALVPTARDRCRGRSRLRIA